MVSRFGAGFAMLRNPTTGEKALCCTVAAKPRLAVTSVADYSVWLLPAYYACNAMMVVASAAAIESLVTVQLRGSWFAESRSQF